MKYSVSVYNRYRKPILTDVKVDTWEEALAVIKDTLNNAPFVIQEKGVVLEFDDFYFEKYEWE